MEKFIYKGKIDIDSYGCLTCDGEYLIDKINEFWDKYPDGLIDFG